MEDTLLTIGEVMKYLKIPKSTIYKLSQKGNLPSCKIGKQLRFRKSSLARWLTEKEACHKSQERTPFLIKEDELSHKPKYILLIDDDRLVLSALARFLKLHGYNVEPAESGEEALEKARGLNVDLIITDIRMPGMDGIQTIKKLREFHQGSNRPRVPEIIITGYADGNAQREAEELGITDYLYKPFATTDFLKTVEEKLAPVQ